MKSPRTSADRPTVVDLFCGAGGLSEGFRQAGYQVIAGVDADPDAISTYRLNFPEAVAIHGDLGCPKILENLSDVASGCNVVIGGPPCQSFSQVRNHSRLIDDPRNHLYREFVKTIDLLRPDAFVMENVPGMDQMGVKQQIIEDLSIKGDYHVEAAVANAADFGVPQVRERLIFVGTRGGLPHFPHAHFAGTGVSSRVELVRNVSRGGKISYRVSPIENILPPGDALTQLQDPDSRVAVTVEQAIGDLLLLRAGRRADVVECRSLPSPKSEYQRHMRAGSGDLLFNVQVPRINEDTQLRLRGVPEGGNYIDLDEELQLRYLTGQKWGPHNGTGKLARKHYYAYRRLHRNIWAWTLNTKADSAYHYSQIRALSVREFARLQSFPDRFIFTCDDRRGMIYGRLDGGPAHSRYRQVGNAVPPLMGQYFAATLRTLLGGRTLRSPRQLELISAI